MCIFPLMIKKQKNFIVILVIVSRLILISDSHYRPMAMVIFNLSCTGIGLISPLGLY